MIECEFLLAYSSQSASRAHHTSQLPKVQPAVCNSIISRQTTPLHKAAKRAHMLFSSAAAAASSEVAFPSAFAFAALRP